jgi:hypothetical protein
MQLCPQSEQFETVPAGVSQPGAVAEQSNQPMLQEATVHVPVEQDSLAFGRLQPTPQSPQFESDRMFVSQPLPGSPSQLL